MISLLFFSISAANTTGDIAYALPLGPLPPGPLVIRDEVGTAESRATVEQLAMQSARTQFPASASARCEAGATGVITLRGLTFETTRHTDNVMVTQRELALGGAGATQRFSTASDGARRSLGRSLKSTVGAVDLGFSQKVPAVRATVRVAAQSRWTLERCNGLQVSDDLDQVVVSTHHDAASADQAHAVVDGASLMSVDVPSGVARAQIQRLSGAMPTVVRRFYDSGSRQLESAARLAKGGDGPDWEGAARLWDLDTRNPSARVRAKAWYNLALYHERSGNADSAVEAARASLHAHDSRLARSLLSSMSAWGH